MSKPILIVSDAPTSPTGLGRICRDLAIRINLHLPEFRVATFGVGSTSSSKLPFHQYPATVISNHVLPELPKVWNDFAGDEDGIILTIWNASWCRWLTDETVLREGPLRDFIEARPFSLWGYFPIDGATASGKLSDEDATIIEGYHRVLAYTKYGADVMAKTLYPTTCEDGASVHYLPHGIDTNVFYPRGYEEARATFIERVLHREPAQLNSGIFLVGVVATNTRRKDWYLAFETCAELLKAGVNVGMWAHTDAWRKDWDLGSLQKEFGMQFRVMFTNHEMSDDELAWAYSACDVTFGIGSGEGWGYPIAESLACGTPVVHGNYAGGAEFTPAAGLVEPVTFRGDGYYAIRRPVYSARDWARAALKARREMNLSLLPPYISWDQAWPRWREWLLKGI